MIGRRGGRRARDSGDGGGDRGATAAGTADAGALSSPYWLLGQDRERPGLLRMLLRFPTSVRGVLGIVWRAAPRPFAVVIGLHLVSGLLTAFGLLATKNVIERLIADQPTAGRVVAALPAIGVVVAAYALRGSLVVAAEFAQARVRPAVRRLADDDLLSAALGAELAAYEDATFYDQLHRARDRGIVQLEMATMSAVSLLGALCSVLAAAGAMTLLHPLLLPVLVLSILPEGWAVLRSAQLRYASMLRMVTNERRVRMVTDLGTQRESAAEIRACQAEPFVLGEYRTVADVLRTEATRVGIAAARAQAFGRTVAGLGLGATFGLLVLLVYLGWVPLAAGGAAVIAIQTGRAALGQLAQSTNMLLEQGLYVDDYRRFLTEARSRVRSTGDRQPPARPASIELAGVGFRYPGATGRPALSAVSLRVAAGESIALVGENGSGKTTLARLIAGLYRPTEGRISWDGTDVEDLDVGAFCDRVVMMQQHPVRWPSDARTNVRAGRHDRDDPDDLVLHDAARRALADEVVAGLPHGWGTLLSKYFRDGRDLSGGQWQRIAVARGLFRDAPLLIWDEPTAPLDPAAEYAVYESLRELARRRTVILITHRLASVRHVDRIYLLHEGEVVERGTHDELVALGGRYARMFELQQRLHGVRPVASDAGLAR